eukprot:3746494-Rhodomonas_salina.1
MKGWKEEGPYWRRLKSCGHTRDSVPHLPCHTRDSVPHLPCQCSSLVLTLPMPVHCLRAHTSHASTVSPMPAHFIPVPDFLCQYTIPRPDIACPRSKIAEFAEHAWYGCVLR